MENVIQCPTCSKRYRLKGTPPPTFTCRNCQTLMDLSGFAAPEAPAPAPAAPPPPEPASRGGVPASRRHGRAGHRHPRGARAGRGGGDGAYDDGGPNGHGRYHRGYSQKGPNTGLILGSLALVIVAVIVAVVWMNSRKKGGPEEVAKTEPVQPIPGLGQEPPIATPKEQPKAEPEKTQPKEPPKDVEDARPELREGSLLGVPIPEGKTKYRVGQAKLKTYPFPESVGAEDRNQVDAWIEAAVEYGGRDGMEGEAGLIAMDKDVSAGTEFRAVGRLISKFKEIKEQYGADNPEGLSRLMVIDRVLRGIDGVMERDFKDTNGIRMQTPEPEAMLIMKRWNWWYDLEKWRQIRREIWDPALDMLDDEEEE